MTAPKVAIRLGTEGKEDVKRDAREVGEAWEASASRAVRAYDKAATDFESAERRRAAAAQKIAAIMPQTAVQMRINDAVGTGSSLQEGSARASAAAFRELFAEQERLTAGAAALRAQIDPTWAAQQRFNNEMAQARTLIAAGSITLDEYCAKLRIEQGLLNEVSGGHVSGGVSAGQYKAGVQQLGFQFQDLGIQMAMAAGSGNVVKGVMTGLAMQGPQVVSAIALMRGSAGGLIGFLAGPWGAGLLAATSVLAILGAEFLGSGDKAKKAAGDIDIYTSALNRMRVAAGRATMADLGLSKVRLAQLEGWRDNPGNDPNAPQGGNRAGDIARALRRKELDSLIENQRATIAGVEIAVTAQRKLDVIGRQDAESRKAASAAARESARDAKAAARDAAQAQRELESDLSSLMAIFDPAATAAANYAAQLEKIAALSGRGMITPDQRADWQAQARARMFLPNLVNELQPDIDTDNKRTQDDNARLEFMENYLADQAAQNAQLDLEFMHIRNSNEARETAMAKLRIIGDLKRDNIGLETDEGRQIVANAEAIEAKRQMVERLARDWQEMQQFGEGFIDSVLSPDAWSSWGNLGKTILRELQAEMMKLALINPIKNALFGGGLPSLGSVFGLLGGGAGLGGVSASSMSYLDGIAATLAVPRNLSGSAIGNAYTPAGAMLVGENGPEIVNMPRGAQVMTASESRRLMQNPADDRGDTHVHVYADNALVTEQIVGMISQGMEVASVRGAAGGAALSESQAAARGRRQMGRNWR
ncbi:MAG: hypothetical protein JHD35_21195 [Sphingopyxis sp.]|nr:hypothetical protein [Sphingopyxis sp.]